MAIKNILVAYNGTESSDAAVHMAMLMHRKYGCHVTGLLAHAGQHEKLSQHAWVPENVRKTIADRIIQNEQDTQTQFYALTGEQVSAENLHWISLYGNADATVAKYARMYDLTLVGRYDAIHEQPHLELHPENIALRSGRPVLVVPRGHHPERIHETAVIAWDGQRAATRAVTDAMQILETKQRVDVLSVDDGSVRQPLEGIDIATSLARHGITVERVRKEKKAGRTGKDILAYCTSVNAGLLVMGAYEHSVFRERLLGGTTNYILAHATLPVFISH